MKRNQPSTRGKRRPGRTDRDGDVSMDRPQNTNRIGKASSRGGPSRTRPTVNTNALQRELLKSDAPKSQPAPVTKAQFRITGFKGSKASVNEDGGVGSLVAFLEKKLTFNMQKSAKSRGATQPPVKIKRYTTENPDSILVTVTSTEAPYLKRLDNWVFAGKPLKIEEEKEREQPAKETTSNELTDVFVRVLERRYSAEQKLLDLSNIGSDPDLVKLGIFNMASTTSKFFPALMKTLDNQFKTATEKKNAIESVLLQSNQLSDLKTISSLAVTLPDLKNLDLSTNNISTLADLEPLKRKLRKIDHLILSSNPVEQTANWHEEVTKWFPTMRFLNGVQVREAPKAGRDGIPVRPPVFADDSNVAAPFIANFFAGFDGDRANLVNMYYDNTSQFSLQVNTHALREPNSEMPTKNEWDAYIKRSRNLKAITHRHARTARLYRGPDAVREAFSTIPPTKHASDPARWLVEVLPVPCVPDPSGQYPQGVGGLQIIIHGEYEEMNVATGQAVKKRSFDRTFTLGPGGQTGVRVINDMLTIRAYGGFAAFTPEINPQDLVNQLCQATGMTPAYSELCLAESNWDPPTAMAKFEQARATLPPEAFVVG
ncbi:mRNA export factor mex67 [Phyllosticta capitalensis]|uniref:uncharacterized protein n=1 Tax=Phyllosticta capitalensis TaxID=121624 RepID=UPI00312EA92F